MIRRLMTDSPSEAYLLVQPAPGEMWQIADRSGKSRLPATEGADRHPGNPIDAMSDEAERRTAFARKSGNNTIHFQPVRMCDMLAFGFSTDKNRVTAPGPFRQEDAVD